MIQKNKLYKIVYIHRMYIVNEYVQYLISITWDECSDSVAILTALQW